MKPSQNALLQALENLENVSAPQRKFLLTLAREAIEKKEEGINTEVLKFQEYLRWESKQKTEDWGQNLLNALVPYLKGIQASLYVLADDGGFDFTAGYAVSDFECIKKKIIPGNTLLGEVVISQKAHFQELPDNFFLHLSADFSVHPRELAIFPLCYNNRTYGVLELFSIRAMDTTRREFMQQVVVNIGANIFALLSERKLEESVAIIQKKNKEIISSINYAQRIQKALLPEMTEIKKVLPESFVMLLPRDIVSGDFYWFSGKVKPTPESTPVYLLAAVDCTGHGVPGAFMSMLGSELLNEIVNVKDIVRPDTVLEELNKGVERALRQKSTQNRDGMDMALCQIDPAEGHLLFAGANNPLIIISNGQVRVIKGDRQPIGGGGRRRSAFFTRHKVYIDEVMDFYIFSDGYQDQFGGEHGRKFMQRKFRNTLRHLSLNHPIQEQGQRLKEIHMKWRGGTAQTDDVLVMGFRLKPEDLPALLHEETPQS